MNFCASDTASRTDRLYSQLYCHSENSSVSSLRYAILCLNYTSLYSLVCARAPFSFFKFVSNINSNISHIIIYFLWILFKLSESMWFVSNISIDMHDSFVMITPIVKMCPVQLPYQNYFVNTFDIFWLLFRCF